MTPSNHVDPPDLSKLLPFLPKAEKSPFWSEVGNLFAWLRYLWEGPAPEIRINLRNVYPDFQVSPKAVYQGILQEIARKEIPGVRYGEAVLHESGPFSPYRAYLQIRREFSDFFVCAAPVGTSFFVSVRTIDRYPRSRWFHFLYVAFLVFVISFLGFVWDGTAGAIALPILSLSLVWSVCRYAAYSVEGFLSEHLPEVPILGALYLRFFRPDTFYRQDLHVAFLTLVDDVIRKVVEGLEPSPPLRPQPGYGAPTPTRETP